MITKALDIQELPMKVQSACTICHRCVDVPTVQGESVQDFHRRMNALFKEAGCTHNGKDYRGKQ